FASVQFKLPATLAPAVGVALAIVVTLYVYRRLGAFVDARSKHMAEQAAKALWAAHRLLTFESDRGNPKTFFKQGSTEPELLEACALLALNGTATPQATIDKMAEMRHLACFYEQFDESSMKYFLAGGSPHQLAAEYVGLLTMLPGRWILERAVHCSAK